ncbi:MAG: SDR family NAD(P)-dependent oxidoreductase [Cyclobacteriaceae bacterium]
MKNVLITGAAGNLGKACTLQFASEGYRILALVSPGKGLPYEVDGQLSQYQVDLSNEHEVESVIEQIIAEHEHIDAALLLVGGFAMGNIKNSDGEAIQKMLSLNFNTAYYPARIVFNHMITRGMGRLVFVGSKPAMDPNVGKSTLGYALSKSLVFKLADILNAEGGSKNVVSTVVVPSAIDTPQNRKAMPDADFSKWVKPEEIASAISYACSDDARQLREPILKVFGGS